MNAPPDAVDLPDALEPGRKLSGDCRGEALARATWSAPILPLAPGLLSTTTGWPSTCASGVAIMRACMSGDEPAG